MKPAKARNKAARSPFQRGETGCGELGTSGRQLPTIVPPKGRFHTMAAP